MVPFLIGCFVGAVIAFAALAFVIAAEDENEKRK
jgi:gas vesicle protein